MTKNWADYALKRLDRDVALSSAEMEESKLRAVATVNQNQQTDFGTKRDANVATIVTTSDLRQLIPIPDDATLLRSTHISLKRCEQEATTLLRFVQRELASEMQESGVSFAPSALDKVAEVTKKVRGAAAIQFPPRKQLTFHGESERSSLQIGDANGSTRHSFAQNESSYRFYNDSMRKRANVLEKMRLEVEARHEVYDEVERAVAQLNISDDLEAS